MTDHRIPVVLLTGFLGSGKTTLLNRLIASPELANTLVIINEFGAIGLDNDLVAHSNEDDTIIEMASGCLCCTIKGDLQKTLKDAPVRFAKEGGIGFERIIIETTGLADPAPIIHTVMSDGELQNLYRLSQVVTMVDAVNGVGTLDRQPEAIKQVAMADTLLVSKVDLADAAALARIEGRLQKLNPVAEIHRVSPESGESAAFLGDSAFNPDLKPQEVQDWLSAEAYSGHGHHHHDGHGHEHDHHHHHHDINRHDDRIRSVCITLEEPISAQVFDEWFSLLTTLNGVNMLRVKGILNLQGMDKPLVIHGVQHIWHPPGILPDWPSDDRRSRIVFIMRDMEQSDLLSTLAFVRDRHGKVEHQGLTDAEQSGLL